VLLLAASGAANAYTRLDTPDQLLSTGYGQVTTAKILLLLVLVGIAAMIRRRLIGRLTDDGRRIVSQSAGALSKVLLVIAIAFGTINVVGGFLVTDRMLGMFKRKPEPKKADEPEEGAS